MSIEIPALQARALLNEYGVKPRKSLGQNFLISSGAREIIIEIADLQPDDAVLEIGAGLGALTERLVQEASRVVSVELDETLLGILKDRIGDTDNLAIVQGDILELEPAALGLNPGYVVVANIPYNITSAVIRHLMESQTPAARVILTIQKEVAERIVADPGDMSLLAISVQLFGDPSIQAYISPGSFYPEPSVESAVTRIDMRSELELSADEIETVFKLARAGFAQKRKQLKNALAHGLPLDKSGAEELLRACGIEPRTRAQVLSVESWIELAKAYQRGEDNQINSDGLAVTGGGV